MNDVNRALREMTEIFDRLGLAYAVMGGIAVRTYGIPRPTYDVDFTLAIPRDRLNELYDLLAGQGYTIPDHYRSGWVDEVAGMPLVKFRIYSLGKGVDVDVFLAESSFQQELIRRRILAETGGESIWLVSPEDLVLLKLLANRARDLADIQDVMFTQGAMDLAYLEKWADFLGVSSRLKAALEQQN